jgi:MFS family permease
VFLSGQVTSIMGDGLALLAIPLLVLQVTRNPLLAALAATARSAGYFVVGIPAGPLADRLDATRVVRVADTVRFVIFVVLGGLAWLHAGQVWIVLVLACASACASVFFDASLAILVQDLFPGERVLGANASIETASQLARVAGPAVAALLATLAGIGAALWADAATYLASLATVTMVAADSRAARPARPGPAPPRRPLRSDFTEGLTYLRKQRLILVLTILFAITNLCLGADSLLVYLGKITFHLPALQVSAVIAAGGAAGVAGAIAAPRAARRLPRVPLVAAAVTVAGVAAIGIGLSRGLASLMVANACLLFATSQASLLVRAIRQEIVPRELLGRVTAAVRTLFVSATPLGAILAGAGTAAFGDDPRPVFLICGTVLASATVAAWFLSLRHQRDYGPAALRPVPAVTAADG